MMQMGLPHCTVVTKMDLLKNDDSIVQEFEDIMYSNLYQSAIANNYRRITNVLRNIIIDHDMVSLQKLNLLD